jgi:uncharacterized protein YggE
MNHRTLTKWGLLTALTVLMTTVLVAVLAQPASSQTATQTPQVSTTTTAATATGGATATEPGPTHTVIITTPNATATPGGSTLPTLTRTPSGSGLATATPTAAVVPVTSSQGPRTVSVTGSGTIEGQPDQAVVSLGVRTEDENAANALSQNSTQMQALISALRSGGVAQADIRTLTIQLFPRYEAPPTNDPGGSPVVNGFVATNIVEVTVRDLDNLGSLMDAAIKAGGNQVQGISFDISDQGTQLDQARQAAMQDARHKAEQLATLAGARLGGVVTIVETSSAPPPFLRELSAQADSSVPISPGTQTIQVDIQVTWELQ